MTARPRRLSTLGPAAVLLALALVAAGCTSDANDGSGPVSSDPSSEEAADTAAESGAVTAATVPEPPPPPAPGEGLTEAEEQALADAIDAFLEVRSADNGRAAVELMGRSGDLRYAPWLLDLVQLGLSNLLSRQAVEVLAELTGQDLGEGTTFAQFGRYGTLIETWQVDPGPGYREWKLELFSGFDPEFVALLDSVGDEATFNRVRFGGVRRGGIPELNDPVRITPDEASEWITPDEIVLGVELDGVAVAYPFRIIGHHELVNDQVGDTPIALAYCTLCRTGLLFDRRVEGQLLDFQTSGLLLNSNKVMVDRQTDTLWHHSAGIAIGGALDGTELEFLPMETTTWAEWVEAHPETEVVDIPPPIFFDDPERPPIAYAYEAAGPYASYYEADSLLFPVRQAPDTFGQKDEVLGIELAGGQLAVAVAEVAAGPARFFPVGTGGVVVVAGQAGGRVYDASGSSLMATAPAPGEPIEVERSDVEAAVLADGTTLPRLVVEQGFWFSWWERHPDTGVWPVP